VITARETWLVFVVIERNAAEILYFNELSAKVEPINKRTKKRRQEKPAAKASRPKKWQIILPASIIRHSMVMKK
jgi:hypothetical protein